MTTAATIREENRERWKGLVAVQRSSGETMRAFCRGRGVSYARFLYWAKRLSEVGDGACLGRLSPAGGREAADAFCELRIGAPGAFEIVAGGVVVRAPSGFEAGELTRLLRAVFEAARSC